MGCEKVLTLLDNERLDHENLCVKLSIRTKLVVANWKFVSYIITSPISVGAGRRSELTKMENKSNVSMGWIL